MHRSLRARYIAALLSLACLIVCISPAFAHKINIFAYAEGKTITGSVYFSGGAKAKSVKVKIFGPDGKLLGETITDADGAFSFEAHASCNHTFVVETADGHIARYTVRADELSAGGEGAPGSSAAIRQIALLRQELDRWEHTCRLRDVLGGIGYIFGIAGVAFYFLGRRRNASGQRGKE